MFKKQFIHVFAFALIAIASLTFNACSKGEDEPEEVITTLKITFSQPGGASQTFTWKDLDGAGGNAPSIDNIVLAPLTTYETSVEVLNESVSPAENVTEEVNEESNAHLFIYNSSDANIKFSYEDTDKAGKPLGIKMTMVTDQPGTGKTLRIRLIHEPTDKGNLSAPGGDVDIDVTFPLEIK